MAEALIEGTGASVLLPVRPQPLGVFPLPAGFLLIPGGEETEPARLALLAGRFPEQWPPVLRAHQLALAGELDAALAALPGTDPVARYNRFVIDPDTEEPVALRRELGPDFAVLVDLVCFMLGRSDDPPPVGTSDGELAALVLAAQATQAVLAGNVSKAVELITDAAERALGAHREENRGVGVGAASFRWPHDVTGDAGVLLVADAGNHRVLGWRPPPEADRDADLLLGQGDLHSAVEFPYGPQRGDRFRFPYAAAVDAGRLAIADTANNRVLMWDGVPTDGRAADAVLGQPSLQANGENRWSSVAPDTLCWPYGVSLHGDRLAVADSGNNRVTLWRRHAGED